MHLGSVTPSGPACSRDTSWSAGLKEGGWVVGSEEGRSGTAFLASWGLRPLLSVRSGSSGQRTGCGLPPCGVSLPRGRAGQGSEPQAGLQVPGRGQGGRTDRRMDGQSSWDPEAPWGCPAPEQSLSPRKGCPEGHEGQFASPHSRSFPGELPTLPPRRASTPPLHFKPLCCCPSVLHPFFSCPHGSQVTTDQPTDRLMCLPELRQHLPADVP